MSRRVKYLLAISFFGFLFTASFGQQRNLFSLYTQNYYSQNPAFGGMDRALSINLQYRSQWNNLPGRPTIQYFGANMPLYSLNGGVGLDIQKQDEGLLSYRNIRASFNYVSKFANGIVSFGGRANLLNIVLDGNTVITPEGDYSDSNINHNDPILSSGFQNSLGIGWEIGAYYENKYFRSGLVINDLPDHNITGQKFSFRVSSSISAFFQYNYYLSESIQFQPSVTIRADALSVQSDILGMFRINGNIFGGVMLRGYSYSSFDAIGILIGHKLNKSISAFYAYDIGISSLREVHEGSHEIGVKINFFNALPKSKAYNIIYNPRFL